MTPFWRWLPAPACTLLWAGVGALLQPWLSRTGILLFTDTALLLLPVRFFPRTPAVFTVLFGTLAADALRPGPFGLSASILLPILLLLLPFQKSLRARDWSEGTWLAATAVINTFVLSVSSLVWTLRMRPSATEFPSLEWRDTPLIDSLAGLAVSASASAACILLFGGWFTSLQICALEFTGNNILEVDNKPSP